MLISGRDETKGKCPVSLPRHVGVDLEWRRLRGDSVFAVTFAYRSVKKSHRPLAIMLAPVYQDTSVTVRLRGPVGREVFEPRFSSKNSPSNPQPLFATPSLSPQISKDTLQ